MKGAIKMSKMICPECGKTFDDEEVIAFLDNGNPVCPHCAEEEQRRQEQDEVKE